MLGIFLEIIQINQNDKFTSSQRQNTKIFFIIICSMHPLMHKFQTSFTVLIPFTTARERSQQQGHCPQDGFQKIPSLPVPHRL